MPVINDSEFLSIPEVAQALSTRQQNVRAMLSERRLLAVRRGPNNALSISADQLVSSDDHAVVLASLRGTLTMLADAGYSDEESFSWLHADHEELGKTPMNAMRDGQHRAVRRIVAGMGF